MIDLKIILCFKMANVSLSGFDASQLLKPLMIRTPFTFTILESLSFYLNIGKDTVDDQNPAWKR